MNIPQQRKALEKLGFEFPKEHKCMDGTIRWGMTKPEATVDLRKLPGTVIRDVFFSGRSLKSGFYITSNLTAYKKGKRITMLNIFGHGKTRAAAVRDFTSNFKAKKYNISA